MNRVLDWRQIRENYLGVRDRIDRAAARAGRNPSDIRLVVVTKTHPAEVLQAAIDAGAMDLGENYAEEAVEKMRSLAGMAQVRWHMIGHVQGRKANLVSEHFDYLHSLDSLKLAQRLDRLLGEANKRMPVLLQLNVSGEASKSGFPAWDDSALAAVLLEIGEIIRLPNLSICGLMTIPPFYDDPEGARPFFRRLQHLRDRLAAQFPSAPWNELSMGMSGDYEAAVEEGATWLRVGHAILGPRPV